ncbi:MAG: sirohydrochlorin chelatase [Caldilineaceae bacterium]|nr:sirohydrochlorin chelatase [Caldilineaceae bacterium]
MTTKKTAAILVGHGSIHSDGGKSMIRIAARLREQAVAPIVEAGFLNYNQPTLADAVQKGKAAGATAVIVQPYFLIDGQYASQDLPQLVADVAATEPTLRFTLGETLGYHPALVKLAVKRICGVDPAPGARTALLFVAHGTPLAPANAPIVRTAEIVGKELGYGVSTVAYLDCNQPTIPDAIDQLVDEGYRKLVIQPYFLHLGRHVRTDLPALFAAAQSRHPQVEIRAAHHLDYDPLLVDVAAERIKASYRC